MIYRSDIDGMRALAILAVVLFHAFPKVFPGGFIGVDIFFVISGYLILGKLQQENISIMRFYSGRIRRLLPALILVLASLMVLGYFLLFADEYQSLNRHVMASILCSNHWLLMHETGYFDQLAEFKPLLHLWSLSIEAQFYIFVPLMGFFCCRHKKLWPWMLSLLLIASFSYCVWMFQDGQDGFYSPLCRLWEFALGGLLAAFKRSEKDMSWMVIFVLLMMVIFWRTKHYSLGGTTIACLAISYLILQPGWVNQKILKHPTLVYLGLISYPLYLWHWSLLSFASIVHGGAMASLERCLIIMLSVLLASLTYHIFELPVRLSSHPLRLTLALAGLVLSLGVVASIVDMHQGFPNRPIQAKQQTLINDLTHFDDYQKQLINCQVSGIDKCLQSNSKAPDVVVWGDSHAEHVFPGLMHARPNQSILLLGTNSCPPLLGVHAHWQGELDRCYQANQAALSYLKKMSSVKSVVLSAVGLFYIGETITNDQQIAAFSPAFFQLELDGQQGVAKSRVFLQGMQKTITTLRNLGKQVIVLEDSPLLPFMPVHCLSRPLQHPDSHCALPLATVEQVQKDYRELLGQLQRANPDVYFYRNIDGLCNQSSCAIIENGHFLYRDSQHLTLAGSDKLAKSMLANIPLIQDKEF